MKAICALVLLLPLAACGGGVSPEQAAVLANAASQNCLNHNGHLIIKGEKSQCKTTDGRTLDAWEYYHQMNP